MSRSGIVAVAVLAVLALHPAPTVAAPLAGVPTTHANLSVNGVDILVTYVGGLGSSNVVTEGGVGKTGGRAKTAGKLDFLTLTVSRARTDLNFLQWRQDVASGSKTFKRNATLEILDSDGLVQSRFKLTNAWPSSYSVSALPAVQGTGKASSQEGETLTLAYENLARTQ